MKTRYPIPAGLEPYSKLIDSCSEKGLTVELDWAARGWSLRIHGPDTLVECESMRKFPDCLNPLATAAIVRMGRR